MSLESLNQSPLGKKSPYIDEYAPGLLFPIPRSSKREEIGISEDALPFTGVDLWTAFEISWLNLKGKPQVALGEILIPCESPFLIESKSMKLYLNSFNQTRFENLGAVSERIRDDLSAAAGRPVEVELMDVQTFQPQFGALQGFCIDDLDIECDHYSPPRPDFLKLAGTEEVTETLQSHLLKSNCLVTGQPDWGSLEIRYCGPKIDPEGLLRYLISFRNHNEFHEQCVERIFVDVLKQCRPRELRVFARYTRRGGLDINPVRSTHSVSQNHLLNQRLARQ